jgi:hypothetical protein
MVIPLLHNDLPVPYNKRSPCILASNALIDDISRCLQPLKLLIYLFESVANWSPSGHRPISADATRLPNRFGLGIFLRVKSDATTQNFDTLERVERSFSRWIFLLPETSSCITSSSVTISIILPNIPSHPKHSTVAKQARTNEYISHKRSKANDCLKWHSCDQQRNKFQKFGRH